MSASAPLRPPDPVRAVREALSAIRGVGGREPDWQRPALAVRAVVLFALLYGLLAEFSGQLSTIEDVSPWFPPAGLSLAAVLVFGARGLPMVAIADAAQLFVREQEQLGQAIALGLAQGLFWGAAGLALRPRLRAFSPLSRVRELAWFAVVGVVLGPALAAFAGVALDLALDGASWSEYLATVQVYGIGDAIGVLSLTPSLLVISGWARRPRAAWSAVRSAVTTRLEGPVMILATVVAPALAVTVADGDLLPFAPLPMAWVALRRGMPTTAFGVLVWSTSAVVADAASGSAVSLREISALMISTGLLSLAVAAVVTERERGRARLAYLALYDDLTGLPNDRAFREHVASALASTSGGRDIAVLHVRLALFEGVPGPPADVIAPLLLRAAHRLRRLTGPDATLARTAASCFVVMLDGPDAEDPEAIGLRLVEGLDRPVRIDGREYLLEPTIGVARASEHGRAEDVLDWAERAAGVAGQSGRAAAFDDAMQRESQARDDLGEALAKALESNALAVHYQPIVDASRHRPVAAEALLRWPHPGPGHGPVGPDVFVPVAEACGLILPIGRWVLHEACAAAVDWPDGLESGLVVHVNLSPVQLRDEGLTSFVAETLAETGLPAHRLCLELTESALFDDLDLAAARVLELADLGVSVVLDDFGTGASSLSWLQRLPVGALKIDRSFVAGVAGRPVDRAIVTATLGLAQAIALDTVAEGVETIEQAAMLRGLGCTSLQGYLIARPMPADALVEWFRAPPPARPLDAVDAADHG